VRVLDLTTIPAKHMTHFQSKDFAIAGVGSTAASHVAVARLGPGGSIGRHPAATAQMLVVLQGEAWVSGSGEDTLLIGPGQAVVWEDGEQHETRTELGLLALIIEGDVKL
jgi:quercetin dioxygenase-like cupin family protein